MSPRDFKKLLQSEHHGYEALTPETWRQYSKFWVTDDGNWFGTYEHAGAAAEMEHDGIDMDNFIRAIVDEGHLYYDGSPNRRQMRAMKDMAIEHRLKLMDYAGREK